MTYLAIQRRPAMSGFLETIADAASGLVQSITGPSKDEVKANPFQAVSNYFGSYSGSAGYVGVQAKGDGTLQSEEFQTDTAAHTWLLGTAGSLYAAIWDRAKNAITDRSMIDSGAEAGTVSSETIVIQGKPPAPAMSKGTNWTPYLILGALAAGGYWYYTKK